MNFNILIGGSAGQGIETTGFIFCKLLQRLGYHLFSNRDYMSRIRGGHNFIQIRFGPQPISSHYHLLNMIIALDESTINLHINRLSRNGIILCDESVSIEDERIIRLPVIEITRKVGNLKVLGSTLIGSAFKILGLAYNKDVDIFKNIFRKDVWDKNYQSFNMGYNLATNIFHLSPPQYRKSILINGNEAIALGALAGGVSFYSAYPMTPSTTVMSYLSKKQRKAGIVVEQAEDEIAAINMAIGASFAGIRAMTGTSGGGFSLMTEALGLSAIGEIPLVIVNVQRPGPATGLPTRTAQSDLGFMLSASQDEFPRMIISVRTPEDCFYQTTRALNLADKYRIPVILLSDQFLADYSQTTAPFDLSKIKITRCISANVDNKIKYKNYSLKLHQGFDRIIPGEVIGQTVLADSHEHNEYGYVDESVDIRNSMMKRRMKKLELVKHDINEPSYTGVNTPQILLLGWGSTHGPISEAVEILVSCGISIGALIFGDLWPLPTNLLKKYSSSAKMIINIEQNYTGQLARLIRQETGIVCNKSILKYDGRQLDPNWICTAIKGDVI